jgi:transcriptional regulator with XRE-family HTH domain
MAYSKPVNNVDELHLKRSLKVCQAKISMPVEPLDIARRLAAFLGTAEPAEVARKIGIPYQSAKNYLEGRVPDTKALLKFKNSTGVSIDWLLTGEGEAGESTELFAYLGEQEREAIEKLARLEKKEFDEFLQELVSYALAKRAADLLSGYEHLKTKDRQMLLAIYPVLLGEEAFAELASTKKSSKRR